MTKCAQKNQKKSRFQRHLWNERPWVICIKLLPPLNKNRGHIFWNLCYLIELQVVNHNNQVGCTYIGTLTFLNTILGGVASL
ncbi:MAG: hypothetical protein B5M56_07390 [Desulfococcus sp. 4484_241]|nr:MAG: hypothetical protein B5M56_07390 [Desulfococcus sp. 4484_241]